MKQDFECNLEGLEEDAAIFTGLMLKVKQAFEKAKNEHFTASYALWENFEKEIPNVRDKTNKIVEELEPLQQKLEKINQLLGKIQTYDIVRVIEAIEKINCLYGQNKEMFEFLVKNFTPAQPQEER